MNLAFFLQPKSMIAYLYEDCSLQKGLAKLRESGTSILPVLSREGKYLGAVSEGDFLWYLTEETIGQRALYDVRICDLYPLHKNPPKAMPVNTSMEDLLYFAMEQEFVPVVDDAQSFIGIVVRSAMMGYFAHSLNNSKKMLAK